MTKLKCMKTLTCVRPESSSCATAARGRRSQRLRPVSLRPCLLFLPGRVSRKGQPHAAPDLLHRCGSWVLGSLVPDWDSGQVGAFLYVKCQPCAPLRLAGRADGYRVKHPVGGRLGACPVLIVHESPSFRRLTAYPLGAGPTTANQQRRPLARWRSAALLTA